MQAGLYNGDWSTGKQAARAGNAGGHVAHRDASRSQVVIVTGVSGSGKTTVCDRTVAMAAARGFSVAGILTRERRTRNGGRGLDIEDVRRKGRARFAETVEAAVGPVVGQWRFHRSGLDFGDAVLAGALPSDLLVIDEIGPLELVRGDGWANAVPVIRDGRFWLALVVVRPALVQPFLDCLPGLRISTVTVTRENRDRLPSELTARLGSAS